VTADDLKGRAEAALERQRQARAAATNGAELLDELHAAVTRYVVFPAPEAADAAVLWIAASHAQPAWEHAPRLAAVSPLKRCGKSRLLDVVAETAHRPLITVNATIAAVARAVDGDDPPTLLVDEADAIFGSRRQAENNEDLRGLLNAGHQRNRPMLWWDITSRSLDQLNTFAMAMLASIGDLPDTIMDRAVVIRMRRRSRGEQVAPYRTRRDAPPLHELRNRLSVWARGHLEDLEAATPEMPLEDREADTYEPLIAIADLAGGDWPARARKAAEILTAGERDSDSDTSLSVRLLADLREVFAGEERLDTRTIIERLVKVDEAPWGDLDGRRLDARALANRLRPYGVRPRSSAWVTRRHAATSAPTWPTPGPATYRVTATTATTATAQVNLLRMDRCCSNTTRPATRWPAMLRMLSLLRVPRAMVTRRRDERAGDAGHGARDHHRIPRRRAAQPHRRRRPVQPRRARKVGVRLRAVDR
jgi:Protein of unknown function (DUF3631)